MGQSNAVDLGKVGKNGVVGGGVERDPGLTLAIRLVPSMAAGPMSWKAAA